MAKRGSAAHADNIVRLYDERKFRRVTLTEVPLLASVPAGNTAMMFYPEHVDRYVTVDNIKDPSAFALQVKGNSMAPKIENADIVVVSPQQDVRNGDICVIRVNDEDVLKKVKFEGDGVHLIPLNPTFKTVVVNKRDVMFVWKVVKVIKNI